MAGYIFSNNASTTLGSAAAPNATAITVAAGTGAKFPQPANGEFFTATLFAAGSATGTPNEIVKVTARSGDTLTVQRAQEGTTAQTWAVGDTIANFPTAAFYNSIVDEDALQSQADNYVGDTGTANACSITLGTLPTSYAEILGAPLRILKAPSTNTAGCTLNVNNLGAVQIVYGGRPLEGGELPGNTVIEVLYNGTNFALLSPPAVIHNDYLVEASITNDKLAPVEPLTLKGNLTEAAGEPYDVPFSAIRALIGGVATGVLATNGYIELPMEVGGETVNLIIQWGSQKSSEGNVSLPIPFPTTFATIICGSNNSQGKYADVPYAYPVDLGTFYCATKNSNSSNTVSNFGLNWIAVGW